MRALALISLLCLLAGCEQELSIGALHLDGSVGDGTTGGGNDGASDARAGDGGRPSGPDGSVDLCARRGALYDVGDGPGTACSDGSVRRAHRFVVCSCGDLQTSASITTDSFDSVLGAYVPGEGGGSLGLNGSFFPTTSEIGGSLWIGGSNGAPLMGNLSVQGNLLDQGQLDGSHAVIVGGSASIGGNAHVDSLSVGGTLLVSQSSDVAIAQGAPPFTRGTVQVPAACDCSTPLDVQALIDAAAMDNDNASIGLDPKKSMKSLDGAVELTLPCGRYYVEEFYAPNPITLTITGPVDLYVRKTIVADLAGTVQFQLAAGGELDLFVETGFSTSNRLQIGAPSAPTRTRIYVGGGQNMYFGGQTTLAASLYAPQSALVTAAAFELFGAMFIERASSSGTLTLHYDRALARDACEPASCTSDTQCNVQTCASGACSPCNSKADCPAPLRCDHASCLP